ncbi:MAG: Eco57I restriction-modification methylase domain-containing protein, partial [Bacteroidetes bacterium]|nr:Eco57I restriction-modification methylase domain-containing protein [Bacteroidota bacterium]
MEWLSLEPDKTLDVLVEAFSVEKMSKEFFNEYKEHYQNFVQYLTGKRMVKVGSKWEEKVVSATSPFLKSVFNGYEKDARDFCKKLLGRIIFLYFVQKKRWLGATDTEYEDGSQNFIYELFVETGGDENFFPLGLTELFFNALNKERLNDDYITPTGRKVKIPYLNGGLFTRDETDELIHKKGDLMTFPKELFSNPDKSDIPLPKGASVIIEDTPYRGFLDFLNAYNFTVYEDGQDDHTVAVDPEMLGHIFENLLEDNKDKGAFYTPKEIVNYMCQESLIEYIKSAFDKEIDEESINVLIREKDVNNLSKPDLLFINDKLESVKICDPAIGSGAFPMGLLQEIFNIREIISYETNLEWDAGKIKEEIIQNTIYGVDIEKGAVDIARLRFWLSLVVDKEKPKALPNLDYKIVVGDSLLSKVKLNEVAEVIEIDWSIDTTKDGIFGQQLAEDRIKIIRQINEKQIEFFHPNSKNKEQLKIDIKDLKIDLLIKQLETMVATKGILVKPDEQSKKVSQLTKRYLETVVWKKNIEKLKQLKQQGQPFDHFDWRLDFPEILNEALAGKSQGFDIVIGNPPYVQLQKMGEIADHLSKGGYETYTRTGDIYCLFYEIGYQLLKPRGILTFITSNKWMRAAYGEALRKYFITHSNPLILIDFGGFQVFESATVDTNILIGEKNLFENKVQTCVLKKGIGLKNMSDYFRQNCNLNSFNTDSSWVVLSSIEYEIKQKVENAGRPLKDWDIQMYRGVLTGYNDAFIINKGTR